MRLDFIGSEGQWQRYRESRCHNLARLIRRLYVDCWTLLRTCA
jgi:hypothetical protein